MLTGGSNARVDWAGKCKSDNLRRRVPAPTEHVPNGYGGEGRRFMIGVALWCHVMKQEKYQLGLQTNELGSPCGLHWRCRIALTFITAFSVSIRELSCPHCFLFVLLCQL